MINDAVYIYNFDRYRDRYMLYHHSGVIESISGMSIERNMDSMNFGNIKRFLIGASAIVYVFDGAPYMRVGRKLEKITNDVCVRQFNWGPLSLYILRCGKISEIEFGTRWLDFISCFLDPTYDELDRESVDFSAYAKRIF